MGNSSRQQERRKEKIGERLLLPLIFIVFLMIAFVALWGSLHSDTTAPAQPAGTVNAESGQKSKRRSRPAADEDAAVEPDMQEAEERISAPQSEEPPDAPLSPDDAPEAEAQAPAGAEAQTAPEMHGSFCLVVPEGYDVSYDGLLLDPAGAESETRLFDMQDDSDLVISPVRWYHYTVSGEITGRALSVEAPKDRSTVTTASGAVFYTLPEEETTDLRNQAQDFVRAVLVYYMMGNYNTRSYMYSALSYVQESSQAYNLIRDSYDGVTWGTCFSNATFDVNAGDVYVLAGNCLMVEVAYHTEGSVGEYRNVAEGTYRVYFLNNGDGYGIYGLYSVLTEDVFHDLTPVPLNDEGERPLVQIDETNVSDEVEVIDIRKSTFKGKMLIVHDPSRVIVGTLDYWGGNGLYLTEFVEKYNALAATNAGGFDDPGGMGTGGMPDGLVMKDGEISWGSRYDTYNGVIGFDANYVMHVGTMTGQQALDLGLVTAVSFPPGPTLIKDGVKQTGLGGGVNPRTCVGQRADGAVLIAVIEGRHADSIGATYDDLADLMEEYGAVNAGNLDGGSSSAMIYGGEQITQGSNLIGGRPLATAIIVLHEGDIVP